jgi:hypothetical protein
MKNNEVYSKSVHWVESSDRYIYVVREYDEIVGLNYMQGDDLGAMKDTYMAVDVDLTSFYQSIEVLLGNAGHLNTIDDAIWAYVRYKDNNGKGWG